MALAKVQMKQARLAHENTAVSAQNITVSQREKSTMRNAKMQSMKSIVASVSAAMSRPIERVVLSQECWS